MRGMARRLRGRALKGIHGDQVALAPTGLMPAVGAGHQAVRAQGGLLPGPLTSQINLN